MDDAEGPEMNVGSIQLAAIVGAKGAVQVSRSTVHVVVPSFDVFELVPQF